MNSYSFDFLLKKAEKYARDTIKATNEYLHTSTTEILKFTKTFLVEMNRSGIHGVAPSQKLCEAMLQTEITIDVRDFKLPYDPFVVRLPSNENNFTYGVVRLIDKEFHLFLMDNGIINLFNSISNPNDPLLQKDGPLWDGTLIKIPLDDNIENIFSTENIKKYMSSFHDVPDLVRLCINTILYLNTRKDEEITTRDIDDSIKRIRVIRPEIKIKEYGFIQEIKIKVKKVQVVESEASEDESAPRSPHWRRGHWRTQHFGKGNEKSKLIFIQPVFINPCLFKGDMKDTGAVYK